MVEHPIKQNLLTLFFMATPLATPLFTTQATSRNGGRSGGSVKSADGVIDLNLVVPKEMGGPGGHGANPEVLFAAGYSSCFEGALRVVAGMEKVKLGPDTTVTAHITFGKTDDGGFGIQAALEVHVDGVDHATAQSLVEKAHQVCPYSRATRGNIVVDLKAV